MSRGLLLSLVASLGLAACTANRSDPAPPDGFAEAGSLRLVAFSSCDEALRDLKTAAKRVVGPYGLPDPNGTSPGIAVPDARVDAESGAGADAAAPAPGDGAEPPSAVDEGAPPEHSSTNVHETGVDEPDIVKTDGHRVVTVTGGTLRVVDTASRTVSGTLQLPTGVTGGGVTDLLLHGDRALVLIAGTPDIPVPPTGRPVAPDQMVGARLFLVDLGAPGQATTPTELGSLTVDGAYVDARQVGATVRVVVRSGPRLAFPSPDQGSDAERIIANRAVIDAATVDQWLPRFRTEWAGRTSEGRVGCEHVVHPARYSGASLLSVFTVDLAGELGNGDPVTIAADGSTVYGTGKTLYVANDQSWTVQPSGWFDRDDPDASGSGSGSGSSGSSEEAPEVRTELYKFDTSGPGRPTHVASGAVDGVLLNQYSMSEHEGFLRVATTEGTAWNTGDSSESTVTVLEQRGARLTTVGSVGGLGRGERIYAVRYVGPIGYVVTFRETDPLYTLDLSDPTAPTVVGELKITGYSAYLHPVDDERLIGFGQDATEDGMTTGVQVSLFDVSDPAQVGRVAQHHVENSYSAAEHDPHAFLYWPETGTLVVPMMGGEVSIVEGDRDTSTMTGPSALVLKVEDGRFVEVGEIRHEHTGDQLSPAIERTMVIRSELWTLSYAGLQVNDLRSLEELAWIPFN